jgi:hypothetical protein
MLDGRVIDKRIKESSIGRFWIAGIIWHLQQFYSLDREWEIAIFNKSVNGYNLYNQL